MSSKSAANSSGKVRLVVVESPTKAKTIRKFLGKGFLVESCMGHIRDLPQSAKDIPEKYKKYPWAHLGVNVDEDFAPIYCIPKDKTKVVKTLKELLQEADELILATDEDREGESISWHLVEVLKPNVPIKRMVFHEITKEAIEEALGHFRDIDSNLVKAQEARRVLDRLVGYTISPLIWKKIAYGLSAGRVQSVAVRLIVEREHERIKFKKSSYASLLAKNEKDKGEFESKLFKYQDKRVAQGRDFDSKTGQLLVDKKNEVLALDAKKAGEILQEIKGEKWKVLEVEESPVSRKPAPPFITSTLQQEANRKLGMSSRETMQVAQKLYEQGFITYMRTDSTNLSQQAIQAARACIEKKFGKSYLPPQPRDYTGKKAKGAQEAHEAIRPAGTAFQDPDETGLSGSQLKLYELIWMRTVACQMVNSEQKQVQVKLQCGPAQFSASGMTIEFPGFLKAYVEGYDDPEAALEEREVRLPKMKVGDQVDLKKMEVTEHETKPPARYTEASLVQMLEKEGVGRPSTYAAIIGTIQDRGYVRKVQNALVPTFTAMIVSKLLESHLPRFVDLGFTSSMEKSLDDIAEGELDWKKYLKTVYFGKEGIKTEVEAQEKSIDPDEAREIQLEGLKGLSFRVGRYGAYVCRVAKGEEEVCASLPETHAPADITADMANKLIDQKISGADALGKDPKTGESVYVLNGRYGPYVQLGDGEKPKRTTIPPGTDPEKLSLQEALDLLSLPKTLGKHPETGKEIKAGLGRFGPYVVHDGDYRSIPKTDSLFAVDLKRALELLAQPKRGRGANQVLKDFGQDPGLGETIQLLNGRYGPYIKAGKVNVSLPEGVKPEDVDKVKALALLQEKMGNSSTGKASAGGKAKKKSIAPPKLATNVIRAKSKGAKAQASKAK